MNEFIPLLILESHVFLRNLLIILLILIIFALLCYILFNSIAKKLKVKRVTFYENSSERDNFKFIFISDLHINCLPVDRRKIVSEIAAESPDFIVFTGDFAHSDEEKYKKESLDFFASLTDAAACPIYITYGNHDIRDFFSSDRLKRDAFTRALTDISPRIRVLENTCEIFRKNGSSIVIGGLNDITENESGGKDLCAKWKNIADSENARFMTISHNPDILLTLGDDFADFFLAGHTHAGQIRLPFHAEFKILRMHDKLPCRGIYYGKTVFNNVPIYITSGLGCSILPIRFGTYPEIVLIETGMK